MVHSVIPGKPRCSKCGSGDVDYDVVSGDKIKYCLDCGHEELCE